MACMFCGSEADLTREHVFPASVGGELTVPDGSCKGCNGEFGKWESTIWESTRFLLNLLQIENRDGEVPTARVEVEIRGMNANGLFGKREAAGTTSLSEVVVPSGTGRQETSKGAFRFQRERRKVHRTLLCER
jgi:hypothetical protein